MYNLQNYPISYVDSERSERLFDTRRCVARRVGSCAPQTTNTLQPTVSDAQYSVQETIRHVCSVVV